MLRGLFGTPGWLSARQSPSPLYYSFLQSLFHILSTSEVKSESLGEQDKCMVFIPSNLFFGGGEGKREVMGQNLATLRGHYMVTEPEPRWTDSMYSQGLPPATPV